MSEPGAAAAPNNPFCTRRVRPGALTFCFPPDQTAARLVERLRENGWWGQVVGPHGSGKSALVATLRTALQQAGRRPLLMELHDGQRGLPIDLKRACLRRDATVLIVDGYEQLGPWSRLLLKRRCRRLGIGLLATAHASVGLPELLRTTTTSELGQRIVDQLQRGYPPHVTREDVAEQFARHGGDLREMLFGLYDLYERRRRARSC